MKSWSITHFHVKINVTNLPIISILIGFFITIKRGVQINLLTWIHFRFVSGGNPQLCGWWAVWAGQAALYAF